MNNKKDIKDNIILSLKNLGINLDSECDINNILYDEDYAMHLNDTCDTIITVLLENIRDINRSDLCFLLDFNEKITIQSISIKDKIMELSNKDFSQLSRLLEKYTILSSLKLFLKLIETDYEYKNKIIKSNNLFNNFLYLKVASYLYGKGLLNTINLLKI